MRKMLVQLSDTIVVPLGQPLLPVATHGCFVDVDAVHESIQSGRRARRQEYPVDVAVCLEPCEVTVELPRQLAERARRSARDIAPMCGRVERFGVEKIGIAQRREQHAHPDVEGKARSFRSEP
jgi:hypothetical protein